MNRFLSFIVMMICAIECSMAQISVSGHVINKATEVPIEGANVIVKNGNGKIAGFASTDSEGAFSIDVADSTKLTVNVSMLGFKKYSMPINEIHTPLTIKLDDGNYSIKEVVVKADRIRANGDTIKYNVATFTQKQDRTIGDVMKHMPGIDVKDNGSIEYQGLAINKFYIEDNDLLGGKYGVATNGISANDIGMVEVLENHQPMQVLSGINLSDQAAINLKLKNKSKGTWLLNGQLADGVSTQPKGMVWDGDLFLMKAQPKYQTITTLKSNNAGKCLESQTTDFLEDERNTQLSDYISLSLPSISYLDAKRSLFNRSHMFSTSHMWKKKTIEYKGQIDYYNYRNKMSAASSITYFMPNSTKVITEDRNGMERGNQLTGSFVVEMNQKDYFLNNTFKPVLKWNDTSVSMSENFQKAECPNFYLSNKTKMIKRFAKKHLITFYADNEWENLTSTLDVNFTHPANGKIYQKNQDYAFFTNEKAQYAFTLSGLKLSLEGGVEGYFRKMDSKIDNASISLVAGMPMQNSDLTTNYLKLFVTPQIGYAFSRFNVDLLCPISYDSYHLSMADDYNKLFVSPTLKLRWQPIQGLAMTVTGKLNEAPTDLHDIHEFPLFSDYRTIDIGVNKLYTTKNKRLSGNFSYRNVGEGLFANMILSKSWQDTPTLPAQRFSDDNIISYYQDVASFSQSFQAIGNISKTLDFIRGGVSINGIFRRNSSAVSSEETPVHFVRTYYSIGGQVNANLNKWLYMTYAFKAFGSSAFSKETSLDNRRNNLLHRLTMDISATSKLMFEMAADYFHNQQSENTYKNCFLLDSKVKYALGKKIDLQLLTSNIMNTRTYSYSIYDTLSRIESVRYLRGREIMLAICFK